MKGTRVGLTDGGDGGDDLAELELVEDGGLTGGIEPDHENPHLLLGEEAAEQLPKGEPHLFPKEILRDPKPGAGSNRIRMKKQRHANEHTRQHNTSVQSKLIMQQPVAEKNTTRSDDRNDQIRAGAGRNS